MSVDDEVTVRVLEALPTTRREKGLSLHGVQKDAGVFAPVTVYNELQALKRKGCVEAERGRVRGRDGDLWRRT
ncbi:hypothetical protein PQJ75_13930 [Rhodoplanes sp. TEM]|uniref:Uncharacterized protein n=1 Tax=Rhodoplanes tepidamans TaxID=200616 RepID=A0ABT5JEE3_RHOTP|nr:MULTISPECIES: hypothetical protein [Rhodoplanes]MDC7787991.1 hypothetical protein [Rhodoplanes tepidamans]MDC7984831.1 hypothetical protein [Rhodoplanes sp. TEM]MDQ0358420.1 Fe2+ or Zn2+ uptake regulation protein [Rhodoplanes tepidamans]